MSRRQDLRILAAYANAPEQFPEGNVPIAYAAEKMGKDACFIGKLPDLLEMMIRK